MDALRQRPGGVTLVELIAALLIITILLAAAVPAFDGMMRRHRLDGLQQNFMVSLANAKQAAVTRQETVALCPTQNGRQCLPQGHWHRGWMTFVDSDDDGRPDRSEPVLEKRGALEQPVRLTSSRFRRVIRFHPTGTAGGSNATFTLCLPDHADEARAVVLSWLGRIRLDDGERSDCLDSR